MNIVVNYPTRKDLCGRDVTDWSAVGGLVAVRVTLACPYCGKPVTCVRGGVFSGSGYHDECHKNSGDAQRESDAFMKSVLGNMSPSEYQKRHKRAWND